MAYSGGTLTGRFGNDAARWDHYIASQNKMGAAAVRAGATIVIGNHSEYDSAYTKALLNNDPWQPWASPALSRWARTGCSATSP